MNTHPLVSIVTPSYNQVQFLEETILSVLEQDCPLEYIIVDGGSEDGSVDIIKKYSQHLSWWVSEKDRGQADAINKGLHRAKGEIVAWLNSDDLYYPNIISQVVQGFTMDPDVALMYADVEAIDEGGQSINRIRYGDWGLDELMTFHIIGQPAVFFRRAVLEQTGYLDESLHFLMDHHLWLRVARIAKVKHIRQVWAAARFHSESKNVSQGGRLSLEAYRIVDWMGEQPEFLPLISGKENRILAGAHRFHAYYLLESGDPIESLRYYYRGLWLHPPTAWIDWHRMVYALLSVLGLHKIRNIYGRWRRRSKTSRREVNQ